MEFGNLLVRPFQLVFLAVVLGLSISLVRGQYAGSAPSITVFAVACGVIGAISILVGLAAVFVSSLQGMVMLALDGLSSLFFLASSIALAVKLGPGVHSCTGGRPDGWNDNTYDGSYPPNPFCLLNPIINGGATSLFSDHYEFATSNGWYVDRCRKAQALDAFLFLTLITFLASLAFDFLGFRKHKSGSHV